VIDEVPRRIELDDGVFAVTYPFLSLTIGAVVGDEGVLLVDTRSTHAEARELGRDLAALTSRPVRWVVNTHWHWDHCWGNAVFAHAERWGHERTRSALIERGEAMRREAREWFPADRRNEVDEVEIRPPDHIFATRVSLDIGRTVALRYHGRGHTDGDVTVGVGDVLFAGDLVEESGPPAFDDAHPTEWAPTLDRMLEQVRGPVVPGHGRPVDRAFVEQQRDAITAVVALARAGYRDGTPAGSVDLGTSPLPTATARVAVERTYAELSGRL
jgi:glyoxylase-like metal-dependent hydrolase (beta-lactamase superfamily II)